VINKMANLWGILMIVSLAALFVFGITNVSTELFAKGNLDTESTELLTTVNPIVGDYYASVNGNLSADNIDTEGNPDLNGVSEFFQEFKTFQNKYDQLKGALKTVYTLPDWMIEIVPFVDADDLKVFIHFYRALMWALVILIFIKVLRGGAVD